MAAKIRLARGGTKKRPYYRIVVASSTSPRDGRFIERLGSYNPLLKQEDPNRVVLDKARVEYWLKNGAEPTARIVNFLNKAGIAQENVFVKTANKRTADSIERNKVELERKRKEAAEAEAKAAAEKAAAEKEAAEKAAAEAAEKAAAEKAAAEAAAASAAEAPAAEAAPEAAAQ